MTKKLDILKTLIGNGKMNIHAISKLLKMDYKNTHSLIMELGEADVISLERFGKAIGCSVKKTPHPLIYAAEYERRKELLKDIDLKVLYGKLNSVNFPFIVLLFGSYAKGKAGKGSDIDLLVISEESRGNDINDVLSLLPLPIHATNITPEEFVKMAKSKEFTVVSEAMKSNVIFVGIEDYYRLLENVE